MDQESFYEAKLAFETDASDVFEALAGGEKLVVIDARKPEAYARQHIQGAINLPHRSMSHQSTANLDRTALYVTYCDGIGCNASTKGALNMLRLGFRVKELLGGLEWWLRDGYPTDGSEAQAERPESPECAC